MDARFWAKVDKTPTCWLWTGAHNPEGYGRVRVGGRAGRTLYAHRMIAEETYGPLGEAHVRHRCDNPPCVRPDHLQLGTRSDNIQDAYDRDRMPPHPRKIDDVGRGVVRQLAAHGWRQSDIADIFGVHPSLISRGLRDWP